MNSAQTPPAARLSSQLLAQEPDLREVVEAFVRGLDARLAEFRQAYERLDWPLLTSLAHRLKGAGGSYGYPQISQACAEMEQNFRARQADEFASWIAQLTELSAAARAGLNL